MVGLEDEQELVFAGYCVVSDAAKTTASPALLRLAAARRAGQVVSGDHPLSCAASSGHLVSKPRDSCTGPFRRHDRPGLGIGSRTHRRICRVSPEQKERMVRALQGAGVSTVASLATASMMRPQSDAPTSASRCRVPPRIAPRCGPMILLAKRRSCTRGWDSGRTTDICQRQQVCAHGLEFQRRQHVVNGGSFPMTASLPVTAVQILINNLLYDASEIGIPFRPVEPTELAKPSQLGHGGSLALCSFWAPFLGF